MVNPLELLPQQIANGLTLGAVYALIALGYSMVYGILGLLNFAHGDVYMVGAFIGFGVLNTLAPGSALVVPPLVAFLLILLISMLGAGLLGIAIESVAYRPLRSAPRIAPLISALGVSFFLQNAMLLTQGARINTYRSTLIIPLEAGFDFGPARVSASRMMVLVIALLLMVALTHLVQRTRLGRAMRAVSIDREAAAMMGVDVDRVIALTFFIGSALAGAAGVLVGMIPQQVWHVMGFTAGLKGFTAAVIGGIGNIPGAMVGGLLLGLIETLAIGFISSTYRDAITFVVLVVVLLLRPSGLFGIRAPQKV
jgi:branched-chain amino acid transport system permease protein